MPYIGKNPVGGGFHKLDALTASATATYALTLNSAAYYPESANQLLVSLNGVIQAPQDSFTVSGSNLVFDSALTSSDSIDFVVALGDVLAVKTVTDGAITTAKLGNGAVTSAKLDTNIAVSGNLDVGTIRDAAGTNTAMTIDSTGRVVTPARPAFLAYKTTSGSINYSSADSISADMTATEFNVGSHYQTSGSDVGKFIAPIAGHYFFGCNLFNNTTSTTRIGLYRESDGVSFAGQGQRNQNNDINISSVVYLTANDKVYISSLYASYIYQGASHSYFYGYLIG
jgi:hypothetical protein